MIVDRGQHIRSAGVCGATLDPDGPLRHGGQHVLGRDR